MGTEPLTDEDVARIHGAKNLRELKGLLEYHGIAPYQERFGGSYHRLPTWGARPDEEIDLSGPNGEVVSWDDFDVLWHIVDAGNSILRYGSRHP